MLTISQTEVLRTLKQFGPLPDVALVPLAQHVMKVHLSSSGIRSRRAELARKGFIKHVDDMRLPSGRVARVWEAV